jgi:plasmid stabilization system protein ParE
MRVRWTEAAAEDLARIVQYIAEDKPEAARRVAQKIFEGVAALGAFPARGRTGFAENTRELLFPPWPYIAVYETIGDQVHVLRIRHAARD